MSQADNSDTDETEESTGFDDEPIDGDGTYPFAGLTRYDSVDDVPHIPRNVWRQQSSLQYWASSHVGDDADVDDLPARGLYTMIPEIPSATSWPVAIINPRSGEIMRTLKHQAVVNRNRGEKIEWGYGNAAEVAADLYEVDEKRAAKAIQAAHARGVDDPVRSGLEAVLDPDDVPDAEVTSKAEMVDAVLETTTGDDALFNIPTSKYTIINPIVFLEPLCEVLSDRDLGEHCFGELRLDRGGGRGTLEVFFDGKHVEAPIFADDREPIVVGLEIQWDFYNDWAVRAAGIGFDWRCENAIHRITNREGVKHTGDVGERVDWHDHWETLLDGVDEKVDQLAQVIQMASESTLDFSELPDDLEDEIPDSIDDARPWAALYYYSGLPGYLAEHAGRRLRTRADDAYEPTWWDIHSAATYAITHHGRGDPSVGGSIADQARIANDMLLNPPSMEERIVTAYEADRSDDRDSSAGESAGAVQIRSSFESTREKREQFDEWQETVAALAPGGTGEEDEDAESE